MDDFPLPRLIAGIVWFDNYNYDYITFCPGCFVLFFWKLISGKKQKTIEILPWGKSFSGVLVSIFPSVPEVAGYFDDVWMIIICILDELLYFTRSLAPNFLAKSAILAWSSFLRKPTWTTNTVISPAFQKEVLTHFNPDHRNSQKGGSNLDRTSQKLRYNTYKCRWPEIQIEGVLLFTCQWAKLWEDIVDHPMAPWVRLPRQEEIPAVFFSSLDSRPEKILERALTQWLQRIREDVRECTWDVVSALCFWMVLFCFVWFLGKLWF